MKPTKKTKKAKAGVVEKSYSDRESWMNARLGTIGGSSVKEVGVSTKGETKGEPKAAEFRIVAESIIGSAAIAEDDLTAVQVMERGQRLEKEAIARFEKETGKKARKGLIIWSREDDPRITVSPDAPIGTTAAVEAKCPLAPKHVEALYYRGIPKSNSGYLEQVFQYFVANEKVQTVYWLSYHPDFPTELQLVVKVFTRKEFEKEIAEQLELVRGATARIRGIVNTLTLYSPEEIAERKRVQEELLAGESNTMSV